MAKEKLIKQDKALYKKPRIIFSGLEQNTNQDTPLENVEESNQEEATEVIAEETPVKTKATKEKKSKKPKKNNKPNSEIVEITVSE
jgi:hypothetical protein